MIELTRPAVSGLIALVTLAGMMRPVSAMELIGYFPEWGPYLDPPYHARNLVDSGSAGKLTVLNYAFAVPAPNAEGEIVCTLDDSNAAYMAPYGAGDAVDGTADDASDLIHGHFNQLRQLKLRHPELKIQVALGGWLGSTWFSDAALTAESRQTFVTSCIDLFLEGNLPEVGGLGGSGAAAGIFDGFDIDWEYPITGGDTGVHHNSNDDVNLTALLSEFRIQMGARGHGDKLLTMAVPGSDFRGQNFRIGDYEPYVDWFNLMTYDFHGGWDNKTGHLTNLLTSPYDPSSDAFKLSVDNAVRLYRDGYEVDASKLLIGAAFYGRGWRNVAATDFGLYQNGQTAEGKYEAGANLWRDLAPLEAQGYAFYWDDKALATWLYSAVENIFWSLDDPQSLALKQRYAHAYNLGGLMFWEVSGDDDQGTLLSALHSGNPGEAIVSTTRDPALEITIQQPLDCAIALEGYDAIVNAAATAGTSQVEFFVEGASIGFDNRPPWSWAAFNLPAGTHGFVARVFDNEGRWDDSVPVRLVVYGTDSGISAWQTGVSYSTGDTVFYDGCLYRAVRNHVGSRVREPGGRYWELVGCQDQACLAGGGTGSAPDIELLSPMASDSFTAPADITIMADIVDGDGVIDRVDVYADDTLLVSNMPGPTPYSHLWSSVPAGSHLITVVAMDNDGNTSDASITVQVLSESGCPLPVWNPEMPYSKNDRVQYNGIEWKCKRDNQGVEPGTSPSRWTNLGPCDGQ